MDSAVAHSARGASRVKLFAALAVVYVVWGSTYLALRIAVTGFPPLLMAGARYATAGAVLYVALRLRGETPPTAREWARAVLLGALFFAGGNGAVTYAEQWVSSGLAAVVVATMPLWAALLGGLFGRWPTRWQWLALLVGFVGIAVLAAGGELSASGTGGVVLLLSPIAWALGTVLATRLEQPRGFVAAAAQMIGGGGVLLVLGAARGERVAWSVPAVGPAIAFVYLVVVGSVVGFSAFGWLLRNASPQVATSYAYVNPIVALALGALFAGERVGGLELVGTAITLGAVGALVLARRSR